MIPADDAYKLSVNASSELDTTNHLISLAARIKDAAEKGYFVSYSEPMPPNLAEKLCIEVEGFGYNATVQGSGRQDAEGNPLCVVVANWKYRASEFSRAVEKVSRTYSIKI
jgi:hypothetical protein